MIRRNLRRILTDTAGYLLLLAALLLGWLPGPGGIPLALAGLGLLSVHNPWARRLRQLLTSRSSGLAQLIFLDNPLVQFLYDVVVGTLLIIAAIIAWRHHAFWQLSLGIAIFCIALVIGLANRQRYTRIRSRFKRKRL